MALHPTRRGGILKKLLITLAIIIALVALAVGYEIYLAVTSKPAITHNYSQQVHDRTMDRQRKRLGDGLNQWPAFEAHMAELAKAHEWFYEFEDSLPQELVISPYGDLTFEYIYAPASGRGTAEEFALARQAALDALGHWRDMGVFDRTAELATLERVAIPPVDHAIMDTLLPHLGLSRRVALAQAARMHLAAENGDDQQRAKAFEETLALGRLSAGQGTLIAWLVGVVINTLAIERLTTDQLLYPVEDEAWLVNADAAIEREMVSYFPSARDVFDDERVAMSDAVQRMFTASGRFIPRELLHLTGSSADDAFAVVIPFGDSPLSNITARVWADREATDDRLDRVYKLTGIAAEAQGTDAIDADLALRQIRADRPWNSIVADILMINSPKMVSTERTRHIRTAGTRVLLAIERYRLRNDGAIPNTLAELGDLLPESLRTDPFTEQPWDYQPTPMSTRADGDPLGAHDAVWPYTLRSRGLPSAPESKHPIDPLRGVLITAPIEESSHE